MGLLHGSGSVGSPLDHPSNTPPDMLFTVLSQLDAQPCRNRVCLLAGHLAGHIHIYRTAERLHLAPTLFYCQDVGQSIGQGYNCEISENPKPCTDRRGRRGSGSQYPSEPYALFHARTPVAELGELN